MKMGSTIAVMVVRIAGLFQIITGLLFWTGNAVGLVNTHMFTGLLVVIGLWAVAIIGWQVHVGMGRVIGALVLGLVVAGYGMMQTSLLPGDLHWIIQVLHLVIGVGAMGMAESLAAAIKRSLPS